MAALSRAKPLKFTACCAVPIAAAARTTAPRIAGAVTRTSRNVPPSGNAVLPALLSAKTEGRTGLARV